LPARDAVIDVLDETDETVVVPAIRTIRGLASEVLLSTSDGLSTSCARNCDHITLVQRSRLRAVIAELQRARWHEVERAMRFSRAASSARRG
jgi:mRNA interferase MazF